jgi:hypothetical protein
VKGQCFMSAWTTVSENLRPIKRYRINKEIEQTHIISIVHGVLCK